MTAAAPAWPKAILFDLDDTLWPVAPVIAHAEQTLQDWLATHAPAVARQFPLAALREQRLALLARQPALQVDLRALRQASLEQVFAAAGEPVAKVAAAMDCFNAARNAVTLYPDVLPGLQRLRQRALLGAITNGTADVAAIGLAPQFQVTLAAREAGCLKPAAAIFQAACRRLGVAPAEAVYVGDDLLLDVQGAQQAGLRGVWMNRAGLGLPAGHPVRPDAIVADLDGLHDWLAQA